MAAYPFRFYRDPAESVKFAREQTCKGCVYEVRLFDNPWQDTKSRHCAIGMAYGQRCKSYLERPGHQQPNTEHSNGPRR